VIEITKGSGNKVLLKQNVRIHNYSTYKSCISMVNFVTEIYLKISEDRN